MSYTCLVPFRFMFKIIAFYFSLFISLTIFTYYSTLLTIVNCTKDAILQVKHQENQSINCELTSFITKEY